MSRKSVTSELVKELSSNLDSTTQLITQVSPGYKESIARWSDTAIKPAGAIAFPTSEEAISQLLSFGTQHGLDIAVKGGGHSTGGTSSTDGGLVIDLSKMRKVTVDAASKVITAQGGALWADVDTAAAAHGLATVGGTVNHTGIGGLTLGGGFGWLSGLYGAVVDNLVKARVVLPDGTCVDASEHENPDLFWAVRGAGHNFGVTIEFSFKAYPQPGMVYAGQAAFQPDKLGSIVDALSTLHAANDPRAAFMLVYASPFGPPSAESPGTIPIVVCFFNGEEGTAKQYLAPLMDLGPFFNDLRSFPYVEMNGMLNAFAVHGGRRSIKGLTFTSPIRKDYAQWLFDEYLAKMQKEPDLLKSYVSIEFYNLEKTMQIPANAMAFPTRAGYQAGVIGLCWDDDTKDMEHRSWGRFLQTKCREEILLHGSKPSSETVVEYANYVEPGDLAESDIFGPNTKRLAQLKGKYDPHNMFYKTSPIKSDIAPV